MKTTNRILRVLLDAYLCGWARYRRWTGAVWVECEDIELHAMGRKVWERVAE